MISCPKGKEYHQQLKDTFPNLSAKIMELLDTEMTRVKQISQTNQARDKWVIITVYPEMKRLFKINDAFSLMNKESEVVETMKQNGLTITEQDAATLINKFQNECNDKGY